MGASLSACASHCTMTWLGTCEKLSLEPPTPTPHPQPRGGRPQLLLRSSGRVWAGARNQLLKVFFLEKVVCDILGVRMLLPITLRLYLELRPFKYLHVTIISFQEKPPSLTVMFPPATLNGAKAFLGPYAFWNVVFHFSSS